MFVMFHELGKRVQDFWPTWTLGYLGYDMSRTHSIMRIATTASPVRSFLLCVCFARGGVYHLCLSTHSFLCKSAMRLHASTISPCQRGGGSRPHARAGTQDQGQVGLGHDRPHDREQA